VPRPDRRDRRLQVDVLPGTWTARTRARAPRTRRPRRSRRASSGGGAPWREIFLILFYSVFADLTFLSRNVHWRGNIRHFRGCFRRWRRIKMILFS
jgi:hypothetical protein